jgi:hypothetical protein
LKKVEKNKRKIFIVPYIDQEMNFWEKLSSMYGDYIKEVYFPINCENIGTGRPKQPDNHLTEFLESRILPVSGLLNPVVLPRPLDEITGRIIDKLEYYLTNYSLTGLTVTNLSLAQSIKNKFPALKLTASTLMEVYNEQQVVMLDEVFDCLVPSTRVLRDLRTLKKLRKAFRGKIRIMVNESCLSSCVFRTQHFYEMSNSEIEFPRSLCSILLEQHSWLRLTGGWVLPQHLFLLDGLYDEIKLAGRVTLRKPDRYFKVFESYIFNKTLYPHEIGGGPAMVTIPVNITTDFYQYTLSCKKNCTICTVCADYWEKNSVKNE